MFFRSVMAFFSSGRAFFPSVVPFFASDGAFFRSAMAFFSLGRAFYRSDRDRIKSCCVRKIKRVSFVNFFYSRIVVYKV